MSLAFTPPETSVINDSSSGTVPERLQLAETATQPRDYRARQTDQPVGQASNQDRLSFDISQRVPIRSEAEGAAEHTLFAILSFVISESEAQTLARDLMATFGSLGAIVASKWERLNEVCGNNANCVSILKRTHEFAGVLLREPLQDRPVITNLSNLYAYLKVTLGSEQNEQVRILYLNSKNALIRDELHSRGTFNHVPVYSREIMRSVIDVGAGAIILVHNHPSGDPKPSRDDIEVSRVLKQALRAIDCVLHDHIIVGRSRCESMRELGLL